MIFTTAWLIVLFVTVSSSNSTSSTENIEAKSETKIDRTTEASLERSTTEKSVFTENDRPKDTTNGKERNNDEVDDPMTVEELLLIKEVIDEEDKLIEGRNQQNLYPNNIQNSDKTGNTDNNPENPFESKINKDFIDIRGHEVNSKAKPENSNPGIQFDDPNTEVDSDPPQRFGQRSRKFKQKIQDSVPFLQLTQGGYERPFKRPRFRYSYSTVPESSEQTQNVQKPDKPSNNRRPDTRRIVPQVTYLSSSQPSNAFGQGPFTNPAFDASARNVLSMNQILPPPTQTEFSNPPPTELAGYANTPFQPQFSPSNDVGSFPNFNRDFNNVDIYQTLTSNPFQTPGILYQNPPQVQPQPVLIDSGQNIQSQFQQNPSASYRRFQTMEDSPNYATLFRNPVVNTPFQTPANFYGNAPNPVNPFNSPPISFLSQYPNFNNKMPSELYRYTDVLGTQNNQQPSNYQQFDSYASQDENKAKVVMQNPDKPANRDDLLQAQLGAENVADVYMKYPVEAGYAVEENFPPRNDSEESSNESKQSKDGQTNDENSDPYKRILNSVRSNQRINNSFTFTPELFRNTPIDFGYLRPQGEIFLQYPDRNRGVPSYLSRNFESRLPFDAIPSLPENFHNLNNQQYAHKDSNETPACAKENNASVCFEDNEYPKNDILYSLNANSFLSDRLLNPESSLKSFSFVERNGNETEQNDEENYACDAATKYGQPLRAKNLEGIWRIIVNLQERFSQPVRMEVCKNLGSSCSYADTRIKTACVQKYSLQRLLTWSPGRGIFSEVYKIPVACSCQITETVET